jgi:hypothetical protein
VGRSEANYSQVLRLLELLMGGVQKFHFQNPAGFGYAPPRQLTKLN